MLSLQDAAVLPRKPPLRLGGGLCDLGGHPVTAGEAGNNLRVSPLPTPSRTADNVFGILSSGGRRAEGESCG